jgi:hypothetical protein
MATITDFTREEITYEFLRDDTIAAEEEGEKQKWRQARNIYIMYRQLGKKYKGIGADIGKGESTVRAYAQTFAAFPGEEDRPKELTFSHFTIAARTNNPEYWIERANKEHLSVREMRKAIKGDESPEVLREAEATWSKVLRIIEAGGEAAEWLKGQIAEYRV